MTKKRIVVALGGNAILTDNPTAEAQKQTLAETAEKLYSLIESGNEVIISHGNGPQVGNLYLQQLQSKSKENPAMPLDTCVAMTQGSIGFWLQQALQRTLNKHKLTKQVATILTQVVVDKNDSGFENPTKPIGPFYTEEQISEMNDGNVYKEDSGRGWRKIVASPKPLDIIEYPIIKKMLDDGIITISTGGGGIPVIKEDDGYTGVEAVVDKDFASAKLAEMIEADLLVILTGVDNVYIDFNKPNKRKLENVTVKELKDYIEEDQFAPGSMLPKIEAAIQFVENNPAGKAVITSLENIDKMLENDEGTFVSA